MKKNGKISANSINIIILDLVLAIVTLSFFASKSLPNTNQFLILGLGAFFAILPDFIEIPYYFLKSKNPLLVKIVNFEHKYQANANVFWGLSTQALVVAICLWMLLKG